MKIFLFFILLNVCKPGGSSSAHRWTGICDRTQNGLTCQRWDSNWPHTPNYKPILYQHNHCASPDGDEKQWCYTTDPKVRWDYCHQECQVRTTTTTTTTTMTTTTTTSAPKPDISKPTEFNGRYKRGSITIENDLDEFVRISVQERVRIKY